MIQRESLYLSGFSSFMSPFFFSFLTSLFSNLRNCTTSVFFPFFALSCSWEVSHPLYSGDQDWTIGIVRWVWRVVHDAGKSNHSCWKRKWKVPLVLNQWQYVVFYMHGVQPNRTKLCMLESIWGVVIYVLLVINSGLFLCHHCWSCLS